MEEAEAKTSDKKKRQVPEFLNVPWKLRDVGFFVVAWLGIQIIVIELLKFAAMYSQPLNSFLEGAANGNNITAVFTFDLLDAVVGFGVVWYYLKKYKVGWKTVGWRKVGIVRALTYLLGILLFFILASAAILTLVSILIPSFNANQSQSNQFIPDVHTHTSVALIALVLLPPFLEETIFRGFLFPALAKKWGVWIGAIVSSIIFGLAHWQANISIYTFVLGLLLCFMYVKLKSIVPGIFVHMLNNYLAFIALYSK
jgi:membrane protease YdiL (CAAX protease family)